MERYSETLQSRQRAADLLTAADREWTHSTQALKTRLTSGMPAIELVQEQAHCRILDGRRESARQALIVAETAINPALKAMLHARRQREVVEECITRQRERHVRDQMTQERKMLDELALRRAGAARAVVTGD